MDETSSDVVLAQVLQTEEYGQAAYQDTASGPGSGGRGPDLSSDYILARHVQEQSDAEVAMQLQESGGWSNGHGYREHNGGRDSGDRRGGWSFDEQSASGGWDFEEEMERDGRTYQHLEMGAGMDNNGKPNSQHFKEHHSGGHHPGGYHSGGRHFGGYVDSRGHHSGGRSQNLAMQAEAAQHIDMSYEGLSELEDVSRGVDPDTLSNITSKHYYTPRPTASEESRTCAVCMTPYVSGDELRSLPCLHTFHTHCVDQWLSSHTQCPVCMKDIKECT